MRMFIIPLYLERYFIAYNKVQKFIQKIYWSWINIWWADFNIVFMNRPAMALTYFGTKTNCSLFIVYFYCVKVKQNLKPTISYINIYIYIYYSWTAFFKNQSPTDGYFLWVAKTLLSKISFLQFLAQIGFLRKRFSREFNNGAVLPNYWTSALIYSLFLI